MAARGSELKASITEKILNSFEGAFIASDGKTLRIPGIENGERVEIKVSLVAAKDNEGGDTMAPISAFGDTPTTSKENVVSEPTEEELNRVKTLLEKLSF